MTDATPPLADTKSTKAAKSAPAEPTDEFVDAQTAGAERDTVDDVDAQKGATATAADTTGTAPISEKDTDAHAAGDTSDTALTEGIPDPTITATDGKPAADESLPSASAAASAPSPTGVEGTSAADGDVDPTASTDPSSETPSPDGDSSTTDGGTTPGFSASDPVGSSTTGNPSDTDGVDGTASAAAPQAPIGSGDPITDPGNPMQAPLTGDETAPEPPADVAVQVEDTIREEAGSGAVSNEAYFGEPDQLPSAPDPSADDAVAGQPTSTFPQATDPAAVRQPASGMPANAYIPPGFRYGGAPIVDTPTTDALRGGAGTAIVNRDVDDPAFGPKSDDSKALGEEDRSTRIHELEDQKRDQVNASTLDPDAGDTAAPQGDVDDPQPVGTEFDVYEVRKVTSYIELVTDLSLGISFIELAAANDVVNQRYELYPGDRVRVPKPPQPARIDGVDYDGDDEDDTSETDEDEDTDAADR